ncbi:MAG: DASS family sodium-coupled anion symporter [Candidatus Sulfopaludibacter sp.]|nr:DASS family sodium-coupled anion symporter [Candidatus Sulfopaludibacter sp.]
MKRWAVVLLPGLLLYFLPLAGFTAQQRHLLGIFVATIVALVAQPVRMGVSVVVAVTLLALTQTLSPAKALSGFSNVTVWLVFTAFLFSRAFTQTGFGTRLGYLFILRFARSPLSLGYSLAAADLTLAPFIPSDTARGGGVIYPIVRSVATDFGSEPGPTARRMGAFLTLVAFHSTYTASGMFLTGMAANPLIAEFARKIGHVDLTWGAWFTGAIVPGMISLIVVPWLIWRLARPEIRDTEPARQLARKELARMGPLQRNEMWLVGIMLCVMAGWVTSPWHGISNTFVALAGLSAILLSKVLTWEDLLDERKAWDALIWFAVLVMMADQLNEVGVIKILSAKLFGLMGGWPWPLLLLVLVISYCYVHYAFASMTAQVTALYPGFLGAALAGGVPPMAAALPLAYFSSLNAAMTHYGTGSAPVYFGAGYVRQGEWWRIGFLISVVNLAIWMGIGMWWWKLLGITR